MAKTLFSDGNPLQGILGTIVNAAWLNKVFSHRHDGLDQDGSAPLDYAPDTGSANAYAIALTPALTAHVAGLPIHFKATNANTTASTLAVNGLGAVAIKQSDGSDLPVGVIVGGQVVTVIYTGAVYMLVSGRGVATDAEVQAGTDTAKIVTSGRLYNAMSALAIKAGFSAIISGNGYVKFPVWFGGLIIQWGEAVTNGSGYAQITFPITFPNYPASVIGSCNGGSRIFSHESVTTTSYYAYTYNSTNGAAYPSTSLKWAAIGY